MEVNSSKSVNADAYAMHIPRLCNVFQFPDPAFPGPALCLLFFLVSAHTGYQPQTAKAPNVSESTYSVVSIERSTAKPI